MAIKVTEHDTDYDNRLILEVEQDGIIYYVRRQFDGHFDTLDHKGQWFVGSNTPSLVECAKEYIQAHGF